MNFSRGRYGSILLGLLIVAASVFGWRMMHGEVYFARGVFGKLAKGRQSVQQDIAWERFDAMKMDVGKAYIHLANEQERKDYRRTFIEQFAHGFKATGGNLGNFKRWRVKERDTGRTLVAADDVVKRQTLLFIVETEGRQRLKVMRWQTPEQYRQEQYRQRF